MLLKRCLFSSQLLTRSLHHYGITPQFMHPLTAEVLLDDLPRTAKRTKSVCTIGYCFNYSVPKLNIPITPSNSSIRA